MYISFHGLCALVTEDGGFWRSERAWVLMPHVVDAGQEHDESFKGHYRTLCIKKGKDLLTPPDELGEFNPTMCGPSVVLDIRDCIVELPESDRNIKPVRIRRPLMVPKLKKMCGRDAYENQYFDGSLPKPLGARIDLSAGRVFSRWCKLVLAAFAPRYRGRRCYRGIFSDSFGFKRQFRQKHVTINIRKGGKQYDLEVRSCARLMVTNDCFDKQCAEEEASHFRTHYCLLDWKGLDGKHSDGSGELDWKMRPYPVRGIHCKEGPAKATGGGGPGCIPATGTGG